MPEKILRAIFVLLFTVLGIVLSRQGETVLALLLPNSVLTETILGITFMSLAAMLFGLYRAICFRSFEYYSRLSWNALGGQ